MNISFIENLNGKDLVIFSRDKNGKRIKKKITDFEPYFYVPKKDGKYTSFYGKKYEKIYVERSFDILKMRKQFNNTCEADVLYTERFLIDRIETPMEKVSLRVCYFDIETNMSIDSYNVSKEIISIVAYDNFSKKYFIFSWKDDIVKSKHKENNKLFYYFNNEKEFLESFISFIRLIEPDLIVGWNSSNFDLPYLYRRCEKLGVNINNMSCMNNVSINKYNDVKIKGCINFDLLRAFRKIMMGGRESFSLESVCMDFLKEGKIKYEGNLEWLWKNDLNKLLEYNIKDVELLVKLDNKLSLIDYFDEIRRIVGCTWNSLFANSLIVDNLILRKAKQKGFILPSRVKKSKEKFEGAFVFEPDTGLYDYVCVLDLESLYPSMIISFNLSPETYNKKGSIKLPVGHNYSKKKGFIPEIIDEIYQLKQYYNDLVIQEDKKGNYEQAKIYNMKRTASKVLLNCFYGTLGYPGFRLYDVRIAETITLMGQEVIKHSAKIAEENQASVIYGDTDSIFIIPKAKDIHNIIDEMMILQDKINASYKKFVNDFGCNENRLNLVFEKLYEGFLLVSKKRYCGKLVWKKGAFIKKEKQKIDFAGLESKRSDKSKIQKKFQKDAVAILINRTGTFKDVLKLSENMKRDYRNGKYPLEDMVIPQTITKDFSYYKTIPAHVHGLKFAMKNIYKSNELKSPKIRMIYVKHPLTHVVCVFEGDEELLKKFRIDYERMFEITFNNIIKSLKRVIKYDKSSNLLSFMNGNNENDTDIFSSNNGLMKYI